MKILIVDDHKIVRTGIISIIKNIPEYTVVGEAENGAQAVELVKTLAPNLIIMDISMPEMDGVEASHAIRQFNREVKILILTMLEDEHYIFDALSADINGYLYKMAGIEEIQRALEIIEKGGSYFDSRITRIILDKNRGGAAVKAVLSEREIEILKFIVAGFTSVEIAGKLFISQFTVQKHRKNILKKLEIKGTAELVKYAIEHKIVQ
ncbi:MAG: response regulator transcription factor [Ignavibacteriales bacterium]|nr:response regulator transcription factor [Ignavibacteriales bacterium]